MTRMNPKTRNWIEWLGFATLVGLVWLLAPVTS